MNFILCFETTTKTFVDVLTSNVRLQIRFRVQNIKFPEIPKEQEEAKPFAPMEIIVSFQAGAPLDHEGGKI